MISMSAASLFPDLYAPYVQYKVSMQLHILYSAAIYSN